MNEIHLNSFDLNLLRVFVALLEEGGATRAGVRLGLTQSAISHALGRLRLALGDELFVRDASGLQPTPRAMEMGEPIRAALKLLEGAVSAPHFDPAADRRTFHIGAGPYVSSVLLPRVTQRVLKEAPGVNLHVHGQDGALADDLDRGRLDMVIGGFEHVPPRFTYLPLFTETGVWVVRADHPAARDGITLRSLSTFPLLVIAGDDKDTRPASAAGRELGLRRITSWGGDYALDPGAGGIDGRVMVQDSYSALVMISQTDMTALLPRRVATLAQTRLRLILVEPDRQPDPASFGAVIRNSDRDVGPIAWLLDLVAEVAAEI
jgi:DNA-binding transcriptional LysR family regulator